MFWVLGMSINFLRFITAFLLLRIFLSISWIIGYILLFLLILRLVVDVWRLKYFWWWLDFFSYRACFWLFYWRRLLTSISAKMTNHFGSHYHCFWSSLPILRESSSRQKTSLLLILLFFNTIFFFPFWSQSDRWWNFFDLIYFITKRIFELRIICCTWWCFRSMIGRFGWPTMCL